MCDIGNNKIRLVDINRKQVITLAGYESSRGFDEGVKEEEAEEEEEEEEEFVNHLKNKPLQ